MSSDPDAPADPSRISGGHIVRNMIYSHDNNHNLEIVTGWADQGLREYNQEIVRPAKLDLPRNHPCSKANVDLIKCSLACPPEMKLGGRTATCNTERHVLMKCFVRNKQWVDTPVSNTPWYRFW